MATGDTLLSLNPLSSEPPATAYATLDSRNNHPVLNFDAANDESTYFSAILPRNYSGNGLTAYLHWAAAEATTGTVKWEAAFERMSDGTTDIDSNAFATAKAASAATVPGTSGFVEETTIAFSNSEIDGIVVGDSFRLMVTRDANHSTDDTAAGFAQLLMVELKET